MYVYVYRYVYKTVSKCILESLASILLAYYRRVYYAAP